MDSFDHGVPGQMTISDLYNPDEKLFAVSRIFARARKNMTLAEQKTFVYALTQLRFTEQTTTDNVKLDKKKLAGILGINSDPDHLSQDLYEEIKGLPIHSMIEINEKDLGLQSNGCVITTVKRLRNTISIRFNTDYMGLFTGLSDNYITMWASDIFQMRTQRGVKFYEELRQKTRTSTGTNQEGYGVRALKELFGIPKDGEGSYMRPRDQGGFNRPEFEKKVVQAICDDLKNCKMIRLITQPDGKLYEKVKQGRRVMGYRFYWEFNAYPSDVPEAITTAAGRPETNKAKSNSKKKRNAFSNFEQRDYDFAELERALLQEKTPQDEFD